MYKSLDEMLAAKGKKRGMGVSPFAPGGAPAKKNGPEQTNATRIGRVGGMGNGGGKMMFALQQGRGFLNQNGTRA
jgi:hypothetical protein